MGGVKDKPHVNWAPINKPHNEWVQVGKTDTCEIYSDLHGSWGEPDEDGIRLEVITRHVACCLRSSDGTSPNVGYPSDIYHRPPILEEDDLSNITPHSESSNSLALTKNEQAAVDYMRPLWFGRKDGYVGSSHQEAADFCKSINGRQLCLGEAYCPNGSPSEGELNPQPLFLKMNAFPREQWAPIASNANSWLLVGIIDNNPAYTCETYETVHDGAQPLWGFDGTQAQLKEHIMCCLIQEKEEAEEKSSVDFNPQSNSSPAEVAVNAEWFTRGDYKGHTYEFAREYCSIKIKNGFLCPYEALCPNGPSSPPFSPPSMSKLSEQWVPIDDINTWVLVGQEESGDSNRICNTHEELYGDKAMFENGSYEEETAFILCCGP